MVRLADLHEVEAENMRVLAAEMRPVDAGPWITPKILSESKVATFLLPGCIEGQTSLLKWVPSTTA